MVPPLSDSLVEIRTSPVHGRGLFASAPIRGGDLIGSYALLILSHEDTERLKQTRLYHYVFYVDESPSGAIRAGVAFGPISLCNHSAEPNARFDVDPAGALVHLYAARAIPAGEEILIDYGDFADEAL